MARKRTLLCTCAILIFCMTASADIMNGTFDSDLTNWDHNEGVIFSPIAEYPGTAFMYAEGVYSSILSQHFEVDGMNLVTFSYYAEVIGESMESDHFYASLLDAAYTSSESLGQSVNPGTSGMDPVPVSSSLISYGDPAKPYFYHWSSYSGHMTEWTDGFVTSVTDEQGWTTISLFLPGGLDSATIRLELIHDYREEDAGTAIYLDNVQLGSTAVVPVPGAVLLAGIGSFLVLAMRGKTGRQT